MMLEVPPVPVLSAEGLATTALQVFRDVGFTDDQLEGLGWDGEYVRKGVKGKMMELIEMEGWSKADLEEWITQVWEPAHQLELVTKDVKEDGPMAWFNSHIETLTETANILGIGKGLEQSMEAAEEVGEKFYKLKGMSATRFSAYFEGSIKNFERRMKTNICALQKRTEGTDKKVVEKASQLLRKIISKQFFLLNLGILDVYHLLASASKKLQKVEQFPWQIPKVQLQLVEDLKKMEDLRLGMEMDSERVIEIDKSVWQSLGARIQDIMDDKYISAQAPLFPADVRRGRSSGDISNCQSVLTTVENRLTSLTKKLRVSLLERVSNNPTPKVIKMMGKCLDLGDILEKEETEEIRREREKNLRMVMKTAKYEEEEKEMVVKEYEVFKERVKDMNKVGGENEEVVKRFEHLLFETHTCHPDCVKVERRVPGKHPTKVCSEKGKILLPRVPKLMKFLHLILKEPSLFVDIPNFLHLYLRLDLDGISLNANTLSASLFSSECLKA